MNILRPTPSAPPACNRRRGQTLIFVMMVLAILSFVMFSVYDVQQVASARVRAQNASDAAALAGARWQVTTLNAIGEINLLKLTTAIIDTPPSPYAGPVPASQWHSLFSDISNGLDGLQERLSRIGPLLGVFYAQQAAKLNGMHVVASYAQPFNDTITWISTHASDYPPYYQTELVPLLQEIVNQGVAALPAGALGNPGSFDLSEASGWAGYLLSRRFYEAIAAQDWCYLRPVLNAPYTDATSFWGIVRPGDPPDPLQFLPLWVMPQFFSPDTVEQQLSDSVPAIQTLTSLRNLQLNPNFPTNTGDTNYPHFSEPVDPIAFYVPLQLFVYRGQWSWGGNDDQAEALLLRSRFKPQFRYKGADSVWAVQGTANVVMAPANPEQVSWTSAHEQEGLRTAFGELAYLTNRVGSIGYGIMGSAAAKPFGQIDESTPPNGAPGSPIPLVLPVFDSVRLIPIAFSSGTAQFDPLWFIHLRDHLYPYTSQGIGAISGACPYCADLILWESSAFRQIGLDWFADAAKDGRDPCPPGGGGWNSNNGIIAH
ncbi:MAG: hypothetical protein HZA91_05530 [Verrucomicrobia bacterium]|nr:hypothetical protein [Verrucomicrobiota bacterium]